MVREKLILLLEFQLIKMANQFSPIKKILFRLTLLPFCFLTIIVIVLNIFCFIFQGHEFLKNFPKLNNFANIWEKNLFSTDSKYKN
jgi:ABC-type phosphate transport system permease subunit